MYLYRILYDAPSSCQCRDCKDNDALRSLIGPDDLTSKEEARQAVADLYAHYADESNVLVGPPVNVRIQRRWIGEWTAWANWPILDEDIDEPTVFDDKEEQ